jgi:hypothetical protein
VSPVLPATPAGPGTGTLTTVGLLSQAVRLSAASNEAIIIECFMEKSFENKK